MKIKAEIIYKHGYRKVKSIEIEGDSYNNYGISGVIHRDVKYPNKHWVLSDLRTGYSLVKTPKKKELEQALLNKIEKIGRDEFYKVLNNSKSLEQTKNDGIDQHGNAFVKEENDE